MDTSKLKLKTENVNAVITLNLKKRTFVKEGNTTVLEIKGVVVVKLSDWKPPAYRLVLNDDKNLSASDVCDIDALNEFAVIDLIRAERIAYCINTFFSKDVNGLRVMSLEREDGADWFDVRLSIPVDQERDFKVCCYLNTLLRNHDKNWKLNPSCVSFAATLEVAYLGVA